MGQLGLKCNVCRELEEAYERARDEHVAHVQQQNRLFRDGESQAARGLYSTGFQLMAKRDAAFEALAKHEASCALAPKHAAHRILAGRLVSGYRLEVMHVTREGDQGDTVIGKLVDDSGARRTAIRFEIHASEEQYQSESAMVHVLDTLKAAIDKGDGDISVWLARGSG